MVSENRNLLKSLICIMVPLFVIVSLSSSVSFADEDFRADNAVVSLASDSKKSKKTKETDKTKKTRVVVSMGDSYSAGEGIYPFYGSRDSQEPELDDWLAHRSRLSWPGQLYLDNSKDQLLNHKATDPNGNDDSLQWYFVASSGAVVNDIYGIKKISDTDVEKQPIDKKTGDGQEQPYSIYPTAKSEKLTINLPPQKYILIELKEKNIVPDYITMTMGGNDLGFENIVRKAATTSSYVNPCDLANELNLAIKKLDDTVKDELYNLYIDINDLSSIDKKHPCLLIVGYPHLFDESGSLLFDSVQEKQINSSVDYFNSVIEGQVKKCKAKKSEMNIEFIDVTKAFDTHGACSSDPWINSVTLRQAEDLDYSDPISRYSIHPNKTGAKRGYRYCVQKKINELEKLNAEPTPKANIVLPQIIFPLNCKTGLSPELTSLLLIILILIIAARVAFGKRKRKDKE